MVVEEVFVNCYNFNPITLSQKRSFVRYLILSNYLEPEL
jgi:hypothetical protein